MAIPPVADREVVAGLPAACPCCGDKAVLVEVAAEWQTALRVPHAIVTKFDVEIGRCVGCDRRLQARHSGQISYTLGAAATLEVVASWWGEGLSRRLSGCDACAAAESGGAVAAFAEVAARGPNSHAARGRAARRGRLAEPDMRDALVGEPALASGADLEAVPRRWLSCWPSREHGAVGTYVYEQSFRLTSARSTPICFGSLPMNQRILSETAE